MNRLNGVEGETPPGVVTVTSNVPEPGGVTAVIEPSEPTTKDDAATPPKSTELAPVHPAPLMATELPPLELPEDGLTDSTVGTP